MSFYSISGSATPPGVSAAQFVRLGTSYSPVALIVAPGAVIPLGSPGQPTSGSVTTWQLRDWTGSVVKIGGTISAGGSWTVPSDLPYGWYRWYAYNGSSTYIGGGCIVVAHTITGMPTATGTLDYVLGARLLIGADRMSIVDAANPSADYTAIDAEVADLTSMWKAYDTPRPKRLFVQFPNGTAGKETGVTAAVAHLTGVDYFEGQNEPGGSSGPAASFVATQQAFYTAVKAGRSAAQVLGPCPVTVGGAVATNLAAFAGAGGFNWVDRVSFHTYNSHMGDLVCGRRSIDNLVSILTAAGAQAKPRVITEAGGFFGAETGAFVPIRQAAQTMLDLLLMEQYGVAKEDWFYFYLRSRGYDSFPSWLMIDSGQPYAVVGCLLTHSQELLGTTWEARHDFGTVDNDMIIGSSYRRSDTTGVVSVMAAGRRAASVTYQVTGGSPTSITVIDCWGNSTTTPVSAGLATIQAGLLPTYLRLPAGVTLTPVDGNLRYGTKRSASATATSSAGTLGVTALADVFTHPLKNALYWDSSNGGGSSREPWQANTPITSTSPQTVDVDLGTTVPFDTVLIHCPPPWQAALTVLKDFDVQTWNGTAWTTQQTITEAPTVVLATSTKQDCAMAFYDSYWDDRHVFEVKFSGLVSSRYVRINAREVTYGAIPSTTARDASGNSADLAGFGTLTPRMAVQQISVFDSTNTPASPVTRYVVKAGAFA